MKQLLNRCSLESGIAEVIRFLCTKYRNTYKPNLKLSREQNLSVYAGLPATRGL